MIFVKPINTYACEILDSFENGSIELPYENKEAFEKVFGY